MSNAVYGIDDKIIGYRCSQCDEVKTKMWGNICNACRDKNEKHDEQVAIIGRACNCKDHYEPIIQELHTRVEELEAENKKLQSRPLFQSHRSLEIDKEQLQQENEALKAENRLLKIACSATGYNELQQANEQLQQQNKELQERVGEYVKDGKGLYVGKAVEVERLQARLDEAVEILKLVEMWPSHTVKQRYTEFLSSVKEGE